MWLHARDGRAVLAGDAEDNAAPDNRQEVDPHSLAIGADLANALHEWARVADAVARAAAAHAPDEGVDVTESAQDGGRADNAAGDLVSRRGRQLAARVAAVMRTPVNYADPLTGNVVEVPVPLVERAEAEPHAYDGDHEDDPDRIEPPAGPAEPTPWATGITVSIVTSILMLLVVVALSLALGEASRWLALIANLVIAVGLAPSVWLARNALVWRWVAYGVVAGIGVAWIALLFTLA